MPTIYENLKPKFSILGTISREIYYFMGVNSKEEDNL